LMKQLATAQVRSVLYLPWPFVLFCITIKDRVKDAHTQTTTYEDDNLRKNGVSRLEVQEVFASDLSYAEDLEPSDRGNDRAMVIGWTYSGRILEIGIEYFEIEDREHVFHGMDAGKGYKKDFFERIGQ
jgi:uncharacterized DUF497 family protein